MGTVFVSGSFDDLRSRMVRFLDEAAQVGPVHVLLWSDEVVQAYTGAAPKFPQAERQYFLEAVRYVKQVSLVEQPVVQNLLQAVTPVPGDTWAVTEDGHQPDWQHFCKSLGMNYQVIPEAALHVFPRRPMGEPVDPNERKKVVVTGCYDWLHTGHVRFFEETSELGDLYVVIGNDANVLLLKGAGHPFYSESERLYMVQSIRYVTGALVSSGMGWLDAEPEIVQIQPDRYAVNEDGDKLEKRDFCRQHGLEYVVMRRAPKAGLPRRASTDLRGF